METRGITIEGTSPEGLLLSCLEAGQGGRPLLLVHGFTGAKEDFADEVDRLGALGFWVVAPDHRGHGHSDHPSEEEDYSLEIMADDMFALTDQLGWETFDLLGHSMGGMVAQLMAIERPSRIGRLVLMDTHHGPLGGIDDELLSMGVHLARTEGLAVIQQLLKEGRDPLENPAHDRLCRERPGYAEWSDSKMLAASPVMYAAMAPRFRDAPDRLALLAELSHRTLVVVGELDAPFHRASRNMAETIPRATLAVLPGGGHSPQFESTDAWRIALDEFLVVDP